METIKGPVSKIKILKLSQSPLIRFNIGEVSCLIATNSLNFLYEVKDGFEVVIGGGYNKRNQFIVKKFCVISKCL